MIAFTGIKQFVTSSRRNENVLKVSENDVILLPSGDFVGGHIQNNKVTAVRFGIVRPEATHLNVR